MVSKTEMLYHNYFSILLHCTPIRKVQENQEGLKFIYVDHVNILGKNVNTIKKEGKESSLEVSKENCLDVNTE
jgi:hypothetical protein